MALSCFVKTIKLHYFGCIISFLIQIFGSCNNTSGSNINGSSNCSGIKDLYKEIYNTHAKSCNSILYTKTNNATYIGSLFGNMFIMKIVSNYALLK